MNKGGHLLKGKKQTGSETESTKSISEKKKELINSNNKKLK